MIEKIVLEQLIGAAVQGWASGRNGSQPTGRSAADAIYGPSMLSHDSSGWMVNFGDGSAQDLNNSNRGAPSQSMPSTRGGDGAMVGSPQGLGANLSSNPMMVLVLGALVLVLVIKKK